MRFGSVIDKRVNTTILLLSINGWSLFFTKVVFFTLCDPMEYSLPDSSVHGIFRARVLEWVAISFSRESSWLRDRTLVSRLARRRFTVWAPRAGILFTKNRIKTTIPLISTCFHWLPLILSAYDWGEESLIQTAYTYNICNKRMFCEIG